MASSEGEYVALFIDWDNLAISTAADHGGAPPDLRRIVQVAQGYGTVLIARAYAEWGVTSERLAVYRAGVEPVYAPTFRFNDDGPGRPAGGKSLADPCLVSDCVDTLHLHPQLSTLVLVSGDKDLIPIVRLAQMRGKKVVVVGPDMVAAVLKDMADEYIAYRSLVGPGDGRSSATVRAEAAELGRRRRRRGRGGRVGDQADAAEAESPIVPSEPATPHPPRHHRERRPFADRAGILREPEPEVEDVPTPPALVEPTHVEPPPRSEPRPEPAPPRPVERAPEPPTRPPADVPLTPASEADLVDLYAAIRTILQERTNVGRPRLRATNLKDHLIARQPGFSERRYGFASFRDLLGAAQAAGVLRITDVGSVQWISLPGVEVEDEPAPAAPTPSGPTAAQPAAAAPLAEPVLSDHEAVQAIVEMRHHTRLLTPNYVAGTLANLVNTRAAGRGPEEAQRVLEHLADQGILRVDREPQEVDVNGAKHRIRLVHLEEGHAAVQRAEQAYAERNEQTADPTPTPPAPEASAEAPAPSSNGRGRRSRRGRGGSRAASEAPSDTAEASAGDAPPADAAPSAENPLEAVFGVLVEAVRESIAPGKDTAGAAGVKSRLTRALPTFSEKELGFSKFKDFLLAAERAGRVRVESAGAATRVGLPSA